MPNLRKLKPLLVLGGGPKAAALAAKSRIMCSLGISAPPVWVIDNKQLAANWSGDHGFTSGSQRLGTPPEKDIGFPYAVDKAEPRITQELFSRYSWLAYTIMQRHQFGEWIDRGRPHPTHREWAEYIHWVISSTAERIIIGSISSIRQVKKTWKVRFLERGQSVDQEQEFSGMVVTGPGDRKVPDIAIPTNPRILYGDDFWRHLDVLHRITPGDDSPIVVVGGGETAASIVSYLIDHFGPQKISILVLTRSGTIFSRGEGYYENRMFTEHSTWDALPANVRREVIERGDRGVFSLETVKKLAYSHNIDHRFMTVKSVNVSPTDNNVILINENAIEAQMVVFALGFDPFSFSKHMTGNLREMFASETERKKMEESGIQRDLSLKDRRLSAKLYMPMISAFSQGPGFPNLSCLGTLSDRILGRTALTRKL